MVKEAEIRKSYVSPFVLDRNKLARILAIADERLAELGHSEAPKSGFEVALQTGKRIKVAGQEEVLGLDNAVKNPIVSLEFTTGIPAKQARISLAYGSSASRDIDLVVESPDHRWANRIFAEIEEQIERTLTASWAHTLRKSVLPNLLFALSTLLMLLLVNVLFNALPTPRKWSPTDKETRLLLAKADQATTDSAKLAFLLDVRQRELRGTMRPPDRPSTYFGLPLIRLAFLILPVVLIIATTWYTVARCYPRRVFAWGDVETHYSTLVSRRRTLWTVVVAALLVGIVGNLFVMSLPGWK